jgi:hypothetical protein
MNKVASRALLCVFILVLLYDLEDGGKMEATCCLETSVNFQLTTRRCIPEGITHYSNRCQELKSGKIHIHHQLEHLLSKK